VGGGLGALLLGLVTELAQVELYPLTVDDDDDAGAFHAGGQQHVIAVFQPRHHTLADAELAGDFDLCHLRCLADHREVHRMNPVHLLRASLGSSDAGGELRVGWQLVQALVPADEARLAGCGGLVVSHDSSSWLSHVPATLCGTDIVRFARLFTPK
jgi:hypothetical protein